MLQGARGRQVPRHLTGDDLDVGERRDTDWGRAAVFSLGCILWELLAGRPLFRGNSDYHTMMLACAAEVS